MRVVIVGGGVAGLATALGLARDGHEVDLLEADPAPLTDDPLQAFEAWTRKGAPQVWHSHAFLARLRNLLRDEVPDFHRALLERGAYEVRFGENLPPTLKEFRAEPEDEDLTLLACRRITFEWVMRRYLFDDLGVTSEEGSVVTGLIQDERSGEIPRVCGVRYRDANGLEHAIWSAAISSARSSGAYSHF